MGWNPITSPTHHEVKSYPQTTKPTNLAALHLDLKVEVLVISSTCYSGGGVRTRWIPKKLDTQQQDCAALEPETKMTHLKVFQNYTFTRFQEKWQRQSLDFGSLPSDWKMLFSGGSAFLQECVGGGEMKWAFFKWIPLERLSEPTQPIYSFTCRAMLATQNWTWLFTTQRCFLGPCDILLPKTRKSQPHQQSWPPKKLHHQPSWPCLPCYRLR